MIGSLKAEWRKNRMRPAFLIATGLIVALVGISYAVHYYQAWNPTGEQVKIAPLLRLQVYPREFVNLAMGAGFPLGAAVALVLGALVGGSDYNWGTLKTVLTQRPGRLTTLLGRVLVFDAWMAIVAGAIFAMGAICSVILATADGHSITWPQPIDLAKGFGAMWLVLAVEGSIGMALGFLFRQSAVALGAGLIYVAMLQVLLARFLDTLNNGSYKWIAHLLDGQNASALLQSFSSPAFGHVPPPAIDPSRAVLVLVTYLVCLLLVSATLVRQRDVT